MRREKKLFLLMPIKYYERIYKYCALCVLTYTIAHKLRWTLNTQQYTDLMIRILGLCIEFGVYRSNVTNIESRVKHNFRRNFCFFFLVVWWFEFTLCPLSYRTTQCISGAIQIYLLLLTLWHLYIYVWISFEKSKANTTNHLGLEQIENENWNERQIQLNKQFEFVNSKDSQQLQDNFRHKSYSICVLDARYEIDTQTHTNYSNQNLSIHLFKTTKLFQWIVSHY